MRLHNATAEIFVPDNQPLPDALARITHLGIGAHQDDLEFMAFHGILQCYESEDQWFGGVTCTDGAGSARTGIYEQYSDAEMVEIRRKEQNAAAAVGRYGAMIQLDYPSTAIKDPANHSLKEDLKLILKSTTPEVVYTHNPADKHASHIAVFIATIQALRELPDALRPQSVWGCEVWRDLDWMPDADKVLMDVSGHENLALALSGVFDSQIAGGKRYDLATLGRRRANATFFESHATDRTSMQIFGMDLTPLVVDRSRDIVQYVCEYIDKFRASVEENLRNRIGK